MSNKETIYNRIMKNYTHRKKWAYREKIQAWRLYHKDIPDFPFIIDLYQDHVVIYEFFNDKIDAEKTDHKNYLHESLIDILNVKPENIHYKTRSIQKRNEKYQRLSNSNNFILISEGICQYQVNLTDFLDTGLFLDHRPLRNWLLMKDSKGKNVLNLFSYTGSLSVASARGEAKQVTSVDLSNHYLNWSKENFSINNLNLENYRFINSDVLSFLKINDNIFYDIIIIDPPTFSNSKKLTSDFDVERDQWELISLANKKLTTDGFIYFSNNKKGFKIDQKISQNFNVKDLTEISTPIDFKNTKIHQLYKITKK